MSDNNIKYFVIDADSGEVIIDVYDNQSLSVIEKKKTDYLNATIELNKKKTFVKCYCLPCLELVNVDLIKGIIEELGIKDKININDDYISLVDKK